jgi:predicted metalloprotease with PDZ domain
MMLAVLACMGAAAPIRPIGYTVSPVLEGGRLTALAVVMQADGDEDGETRLILPSSGVADDQPTPYLRGVEVVGGEARPDGTSVLVVTHDPGARLTIRYRLLTGYDGDPPSQPFRPVVRPDWFVVHGEAAFVLIRERPQTPVRLSWSGVPKGWLAQSSLGPGDTANTLSDSMLFGGAGWRRETRPMGGARLSLYFREAGWKVSPGLSADMLAGTLKANFDYWGDRPRDMVVPVVQVSGGDFGGRGLSGGFSLFAGPDTDLRDLRRIVAHEHMHSWISRQVGGFPMQDDNLSAWFNEGFTEALTARSLLRSGLWSLEDFAADLNESLLRYGLSPAVEASNRRLADERSTDFDVGKMPYDRGRLLAVLWDRRFRQETGGRLGLDAVLAEQRRHAAADEPDDHSAPANELFPWIALQVTGVNLEQDIRRRVEEGERIELPADLFGDCGRLVEVRQPVFERGFDLMATFRNRRQVVGLVPGGPAERAGLREGDRIRISEIPSHDSRKPLSYRVVDEAGTVLRTVTYLPVGQGEVRFQRFELTKGLSTAGRQACARMLSGVAGQVATASSVTVPE